MLKDLGQRSVGTCAGPAPALPRTASPRSPSTRALGEVASATPGPQSPAPPGSVARHGPRAGSLHNPGRREVQRSSPWSFRFRCRNLRFRFSIFLRRSFIGK